MKRFLLIYLILISVGVLLAQTPTVDNLTVTSGSVIKWYSATTGGTLYTGTEALVNGQHYYASQIVNGVESVNRLDVTASLTSCFTAPSISTSVVSPIGSTTATFNGNISAINGANVTTRGFKYSTSSGFKPASAGTNISETGTFSTGTFSLNPSGLTLSTTYYVLAYATNSFGTNYGAELSFATTAPVLNIGSSYQGGIIAYIFVSGDNGYVSGETHGLIAAISDNVRSKWGCIGTLSSATGTALGTGYQNTVKIMNICTTTGIAARLCSNLGAGWYLPSKDELYKLYLNRAAIGNFNTTSTGLYWSSSEDANSHDNWNSFFYDFSNGGYQAKDKDELYLSRAVRSF